MLADAYLFFENLNSKTIYYCDFKNVGVCTFTLSDFNFIDSKNKVKICLVIVVNHVRGITLGAQLFTSLKVDLRQDINGVLHLAAGCRCLNGTFP